MCSVCGASAFGPQPRALLDAEAMLLVDDRQSRRSKSTPSVSSACVPTATARFDRWRSFPRGVARARSALAAEDRLERYAERQAAAARVWPHAGRREFPSAPSAPIARRCAPPARSRRRRPASFRSRRRPAANGSSEYRAPCRPIFANRPALRAGQREREVRLELFDEVGWDAQCQRSRSRRVRPGEAAPTPPAPGTRRR